MNGLYEDVLRVLQLRPVGEELGGNELVARAVFLPSMDPECAVTLVQSGSEGRLDIHCAKRSIWAHLNACQGTPGFSDARDLAEPAIAHEVVRLDNVGGVSPLVREARAWTSQQVPRLHLDGMSVRIEIQERGHATAVFDLRFDADAATPPGRLTVWLLNTALEACTWVLTRQRLGALMPHAG